MKTFVLQFIVSILANSATAATAPTASELLDRYTAALDATQSFISSYEETCDYSYRTTGTSKPITGKKFARTRVVRTASHYVPGIHLGRSQRSVEESSGKRRAVPPSHRSRWKNLCPIDRGQKSGPQGQRILTTGQ